MKKYLLYIDILGFADLVKNNKEKVRKLYSVINSLNVHEHDAFNTIVFSDTILVYNKADPTSQDDHRYISMYACEFAQDLFYRLIGQSIYFRAIIDYDEFEYKKMNNLEQYFGEALISCYQEEKQINSIGLFITDQANKNQSIFPTVKYSENINFVFFQQLFYRFTEQFQHDVQLSYEEIEQNMFLTDIVTESIIFKDIYNKMYSSMDPKIRAKFQNYWLLYKKTYPWLLNIWEQKSFHMNNVISSSKWQSIYNEVNKEIEYNRDACHHS